MPISMVCVACSASHHLERVVTGQAQRCPGCGGRLVLPAPAVFRCPDCRISSKPALVDVAKPRTCPRCGKPLEVVPDARPQQLAATRAPAAAGAPEPAAAPAPFDPAKVEFISGNPAVEEPAAAAAAAPAPGPAPGPPAGAARGGLRTGSFGRYEIIRELARGGMGIVYQARDPALRRTVALKVLIAGEAASAEAIKRFIREARAASALRHPGIIPVHDAGEIDGQPYFTMDFIKGQELGAVLKAGDRPLTQLLEWVRQACLALVHAHAKGIIHRDLKPANIMIDSDDRPILMDFGLARDQNTLTQLSMSGSIMGTPAYMSPEQALGHVREVDARSDIYSMGVIIYEISTGSMPFSGDTLFETMRAVVNDEPRPPLQLRPEIGGDLNTIILTCLHKQPQHRYPSMKALADDLGRYLAGEPVQARAPGLLTVLAYRARRRPWVAASVVGVPLACLAGILAAAALMGDSFLARMQAELDSRDPQREAAAITAIGGQLADRSLHSPKDHARALALVRGALGGDAPPAEAAALRVLVQERDASAVPALLDIAQDPAHDQGRRLGALDALSALAGVLPDPEAAQRRLAAIVQAEGVSAAVLAHAAAALQAAAAGAVVPALSGVVTDRRRPADVRVAGIIALSTGLSLHSPAMPILMRLAGDRDEAVAAAAERALEVARSRPSIFALYGLQERVGAVSHALGSMERSVSAEQKALEGELQTQGDDPSGAPAATPVEAIAAHLHAADAPERTAAAFDLGQLQDPLAVAPLLEHVGDADHDTRRAVARALVRLSAKAAIPTERIIKVLGAGDPRIREDTATLAGELEAREAVAALIAALPGEADDQASEAMAAALGRIGDPQAIAALGAGCSRDADVAGACVRALGLHQAFAGQALPALALALGATSRSVRELAGATLHQVTGEDFGLDQARWSAWITKQVR